MFFYCFKPFLCRRQPCQEFLFVFFHSCSGTQSNFLPFSQDVCCRHDTINLFTTLTCWQDGQISATWSFSCSSLTLELCRQLSRNSCLLSTDLRVIGFCVSNQNAQCAARFHQWLFTAGCSRQPLMNLISIGGGGEQWNISADKHL